ncbi:hypothetical protein XELAEV_18003557mg, partial [Xenopus laevis]
MIIAPKLLYLLWHATTRVQGSFFVELASAFRRFVWGSSRNRLALATLYRPKDLGGMALPDMQMYFLAAQLSQLWTLLHSSEGEALYQLWQAVLHTELPPMHAILTVAPKNSRPAHNPLLIHQKGILNR